MKSPKELAVDISQRVRQKRIRLNITQRDLAERSGVSFGSIKRFEQKGEISLQNLLKIGIVLRSVNEFERLFTQESYRSIEDVIEEKNEKKRVRAGRNDT